MSFEKNLHYEANETDRRGNNSVIMGRVMEVDTAKARMRVEAGPMQSAWVPFSTARAGPDSSWHPPEPGEQVILACPGGDTNQAVCLGSVYQQDYPAPADSADVSKTKWKDGAEQSYDRAGHRWVIDVPSGGEILSRCAGATTSVTAEQITHTLGSAQIIVQPEMITLRVGGSVLTISDGGVDWQSSGTIGMTASRIDLN